MIQHGSRKAVWLAITSTGPVRGTGRHPAQRRASGTSIGEAVRREFADGAAVEPRVAMNIVPQKNAMTLESIAEQVIRLRREEVYLQNRSHENSDYSAGRTGHATYKAQARPDAGEPSSIFNRRQNKGARSAIRSRVGPRTAVESDVGTTIRLEFRRQCRSKIRKYTTLRLRFTAATTLYSDDPRAYA